MSKQKKVLIISTGGAISARASASDVWEPAPMDKDRLLARIPDLESDAEVECKEIMCKSSELFTADDWVRIATGIAADIENYDGIVVLHGASTLPYTVAACAFALQNLSVPVVFTASLMPLEFVSSDARENITQAVSVAAFADLAEVVAVHNRTILRGCRIKKIRDMDCDMYDVNTESAHLGGVQDKPVLRGKYKTRKQRALKVKASFEMDIGVHLIRPGFNSDVLDQIIAAGSRGIVLVAYGPGTVPFEGDVSILPSIEDASKKGVPVLITNQTPYGECTLSSYRGGCKALEAGALSAYDMTYETAITKLMWILGQTDEFSKIRQMLVSSYVGELTPPIMDGAVDYFYKNGFVQDK